MKRGEAWWYEPPKALLTERITTLSSERMNEVCKALNYATSC